MSETQKDTEELDFETQKLLFMAKYADDIESAGKAHLAVQLSKIKLTEAGCIEQNFFKHTNNAMLLMANYLRVAGILTHEKLSIEDETDAFNSIQSFFGEMVNTLKTYRKSVLEKDDSGCTN